MPSVDSISRNRLLALLAASTAVRLLFAWGFLGFHTGDEVEVLETAFRSARGLDYEPYAIRNLLLPELLVSPLLRGATIIGIDSPATLVRLCLLPFVLLGTLGVWLVYRLSIRWLQDDSVALLAATLYSAHPLFLLYGSTSLPRVAATTAILAAALLVSRPRDGAWRSMAAGLCLALAFACRYSEVIYLIPLLVTAWYASDTTRDFFKRGTVLVLGFVVGTLLAVGLVDQLTWGDPFASLEAFARYTLIEKRASTPTASQSIWFYLRRIPRWIPLALMPFLMVVARRRRLLPAWTFVLVPLLILNAIHHKDLRYLQVVLPFVSILAAAGAIEMLRRDRKRLVTALVSLALVFGVWSGTRAALRASLAAVAAAREVASDPDVRTVTLVQAWAWGGGLFFRDDVAVQRVFKQPEPAELERAVSRADRVGVYREDLENDLRLDEVLGRSGFVSIAVVERGRSRSVELFTRGRLSPPPGRR